VGLGLGFGSVPGSVVLPSRTRRHANETGSGSEASEILAKKYTGG
jgi:hypothetical protein